MSTSRQPKNRPLLMRGESDGLADVEHRRLVALAFADDNRSVDRHRIEHLPHRLDGRLIRLVAIALPHRVRTGDRRLLDDAEEFEGKIRAHCSNFGSSQRVGRSSLKPRT